MSILSGIQTYLKTYSGLTAGKPLWVDHLGPNPDEYAIVPQPGSKVIEAYIDGSSTREYSFAFQISVSTADDPNRLKYNDFGETFADWLETQTLAGTLPTLATHKTATAIEAVNWGYLEVEGESQTGIYLILCKLTFEQDAP